jgi:hypothetical protein
MNRNPLTEKDYRDFAESFCSREFVDLFGIFRADDEQAAQMLGRKRNAYTPWESVVFPHYDTNGNVVECCCKPDKPETEKQPDGTERAKYKYLFPPGRGGILYFSPNADKELFKDISKPLVITEGKKQLIAVTRIATNDNPNADNWHFLPIAINGVWGWRSKATGGVIQQFDEIAFQFRHVYIVFDSDVSTNWKVRHALQQLAMELQRRGAIVHLVNLPEVSDKSKNGIDNLLAKVETESGGAAAIEEGLKLILKDSQLFNGEMLATISTGNITLGAAAADRGKCRLTAKRSDGSAAAMDVFNPADAARRDKFIKQINDVVHLSNDEKKEIAAELINLADAADAIFTVGPEEKTKKGQTEAVETTFKVLTDGRIVEQIRGGFAVYNPETKEHEITDSVEDADGITYTPNPDSLFSDEGGLHIADALTEYGTEKELITEIENYLLKYLDLQPLFLKITALYILFTYIFDKFLELSYINATGDTGSGKSRFGLAMALASRRGLALITPSAASVFRIVDKFKPTLFLDEFNSADSDDAAAIIQILNAGFQRTGKIPRMIGGTDGTFKSELFDPFCPKIIGSLKKSNSNAFNSRCIEVEMERTTRNDIPLSLSFRMLKDAAELRNKLTLYRLRNLNNDYEARRDIAEARLKTTGITSRAIQVNCPLFALIDSEEIKTEFIKLLQGRDAVLAEEKALSLDGEIVDKIHTLLFETDERETVLNPKNFTELPAQDEVCEQLTVERLLGMMNADRPKEIAPQSFGKMVFGLGLKTKKIVKRSSEHRTKKAIVFDAERLGYLFQIHSLPVSADFNVTNVTKNDNSNDCKGLEVVTSNGTGNDSGSICYQSKLSNISTYENGNIGNIKNAETEAKEIKVLVDEVM